MAWPLISDFSRMIRNPSVAFKDPMLKSVEIECDHLGQPKPRSGNFATVYRAYCPDGRELAIRVFNRRAEERRERYAACSQFFQQRPLHCMLSFQYEETGVRSASDGKMYPLVTMDWVDGLTLFEWVRDRCKEGYQEALRIGADVWLQVVNELHAAGVAHGDLQHGNVMVTRDGHFKLVDYDCLAVPDLMGLPNLEVGLPPYQHPARDASTTLSPELDNFSSLLIYTALRALAAQPQLWFNFVETPGYDKLLFRSEDFAQPNQSALYRELLASPDAEVRGLANHLFQFALGPAVQAPFVDDVRLWSCSLAELIQRADWDGVVKRVERLRPDEQIPPDFHPHIEAARQRVALRHAMQAAYDAGNESELAQLNRPEMLQGYPAAAELLQQAAVAEQAARAVEIMQSSLNLRCWDAFRQTWRESATLLAGRPSGEPLRREFQLLEAVAHMQQLLADPNSDDEAVLEIWRRIRSDGGHAAANEMKSQVEHRATRHRLFVAWEGIMKQAHGNPSLNKDQSMVSAWSKAHFDGWPKAEATRPHLDAARARISQFERFKQLASADDGESERTLLGVAQQLTPEYHPLVKQRAEQALRRVSIQDGFQRRASNAESEQEIVDAWNRMRESGDAESAGEAARVRAELAERRLPVLRQLRGLAALPPDAADQMLLDLWDEELLDDCREVDPWRPRYAAALERSQVIQRIEAALDAGDMAAAKRLTTATCLDGMPLPRGVRAKLEEAENRHREQEVGRRQGLLDSLLENNRPKFVELFDLGRLREICTKSPHHQQKVESWTNSDVAPAFLAAVQDSENFGVKRLEEGGFHAAWSWPGKFATVRLRLTISEHAPNERTRIDDLTTVYSVMVYRKGWQADNQGHSIADNPEWEGFSVALWGVFDLGFQQLQTPCVLLGQLEPVKKSRSWNPFRRNG